MVSREVSRSGAGVIVVERKQRTEENPVFYISTASSSLALGRLRDKTHAFVIFLVRVLESL